MAAADPEEEEEGARGVEGVVVKGEVQGEVALAEVEEEHLPHIVGVVEGVVMVVLLIAVAEAAGVGVRLIAVVDMAEAAAEVEVGVEVVRQISISSVLRGHPQCCPRDCLSRTWTVL